MCFEHKVLTVDYFLNNLELYEAAEIVNNLPYVNRDEKDLWRYEIYVLCQANSKKRLKPTDILEFAWDKDTTTASHTITNEEINQLKAKGQALEKYLKDNNGRIKN